MGDDSQKILEVPESKLDSVNRDISELLDIADSFARGARATNDQRWAVKLALDTRLKLLEWVQPKAVQKHDITSNGERIDGFNYIVPADDPNDSTNDQATQSVGDTPRQDND